MRNLYADVIMANIIDEVSEMPRIKILMELREIPSPWTSDGRLIAALCRQRYEDWLQEAI